MSFGVVLLLVIGGQESWAQASDRLEIGKPLDAWYRIEQGPSRDAREHRGWARESVRPVAGREWRYEYVYESEGHYLRWTESGEALSFVREEVSAKLDGAFEILQLEAEMRVDDQRTTMDVRTGSTGLCAEITPPDGRARRVAEAGDSVIWNTLALGLLQERQKGGLRRPGAQDVMILDAAYDFEDLRLRLDVRPESRLHLANGRRVPVIPIEFRPVGSQDSAKPVISLMIDRYGRIVEVVGETEACVRTLVDKESEAKPEDGVVRSGRRDPFESALTPPGPGEDRPVVEPDKLLREMERRAERIIARAQDDLREADALYEAFYPAYLAAREKVDPMNQGLMDAAQMEAHRALGTWEHELRLAAGHLDRVRQAAERGEEEEAQAALTALRALSARILGREPAEKFEKMAAEGRGLVETLSARRELKAMNLTLSGTSTKQHAVQVPLAYTVCLFSTKSEVKTSVQMWVRDEWAIVNDNVYRVGETVAGTEVKIEKITQWNCAVSYKGATRVLELPK
ncbi:MAG: hypothetical protein HYY16_08600 [Planctomycetes bacterium]|nr:hypothetical protein [Planctomycetota bacterium]